MATHPTVEVPSGSNEEIPEEVMAELKKEIARNVAATKMVQEREVEANNARERAKESRQKMQLMMSKYEEMKKKLEWTRVTLVETHARLEQHNSARSERIRQSVTELKEKTEACAVKLNAKRERAAAEHAAKSGEEPDPEGLTDAERMLLQLCQDHKREEEDELEEEPQVKPARDFAKTVQDLQLKMTSAKTSTKTQEPVEVKQPETTQNTDEEEPKASSVEPTETKTAQKEVSLQEDHESAQSLKVEEDVEIKMDLNNTVTKMEAKVAGVREELGQMAMSEQYMRTKQAQLLAKIREKEAKAALEAAARKEEEAEAMRRKVTNMMKLLQERRNKLMATENVLQKKANVVEKVNNILDKKVRRANYVEQQCVEAKVFDVKPKKD